MQSEFVALMQNQTLKLVPMYPSKNIIYYIWLFHIKYLFDGTVDRYKARLVTTDFPQHPGINYTLTFSMILKSKTVCIDLTIAV